MSEEEKKDQKEIIEISENENQQSNQSYLQMKGEKQEQEEEKQEEEQEEEKQEESEEEEEGKEDQKRKLIQTRRKEQDKFSIKHSLINQEPALQMTQPQKSELEMKKQKSIENEVLSENEDNLINEDKNEILKLLEKEVQHFKDSEKQKEEKRKQKIGEFIKSEPNKKRHREWLRYYELKGNQYSYHLPNTDSLQCWESLPTHKKYAYCINLLPNLGKEKKPQYKQWTGELFKVEDYKFFKFDIVVRFWFLCLTYTLKKHVGRDRDGKYWDGMPIMYARKLLFNNMTIGFSPWNYYYHSENYVADLWSDVNNFTFNLFRKGKRPFGFDEYVRSKKELMQEAIEDVDFIDKHGQTHFNQLESEIQSQKELNVFEEIQYVTEKQGPTRRDGGEFTADPPRITKDQMKQSIQQQQQPTKKIYSFTDFNKMSHNKNLQKIQPQKEDFKNIYYNMILKRKKRYQWKYFWSDLIVEQLGQFEFQIDWEPLESLTKISAYIPTYTLSNYHQEFYANQPDTMSKLIYDHKLTKFTIFHRELQMRKEKWPYKPRVQVQYPDWVKDYKSMCLFHLYQHEYKNEIDDQPTLAPKETYYKFGRIAFDRYYIEVRAPWTMLTAFAMGLASIKHFFILNGKYGK